jgi:hypothetical protein
VSLLDELLADPELRTALGGGLDAEPTPTALALGKALAAAFGPAALAVVHYGSHARSSDARPESAHDFFVIVDRYRDAYNSLTKSIRTRVRPGTAVWLANVLPPNVHAIASPTDAARLNKCAVLTLRELRLAARLETADHFTQGRLFQHVQLLWARDTQSRESVRSALIEMRGRTFQWGRCFLPESFSAEAYCRSLLETSFSAEVRPEGDDRVTQLLDAQRAALLPVYTALLESLTRNGLLASAPTGYRQVKPPTLRERRRWQRYFRLSKARGIARWGKHIALYDGWLDYLVQKIARRAGLEVELTERERRWPFIFLWPKAILFLRTRPQQRRVLK